MSRSYQDNKFGVLESSWSVLSISIIISLIGRLFHRLSRSKTVLRSAQLSQIWLWGQNSQPRMKSNKLTTNRIVSSSCIDWYHHYNDRINTIHSSASLRSPSRNTQLLKQRRQWQLLRRRSQKATTSIILFSSRQLERVDSNSKRCAEDRSIDQPHQW